MSTNFLPQALSSLTRNRMAVSAIFTLLVFCVTAYVIISHSALESSPRGRAFNKSKLFTGANEAADHFLRKRLPEGMEQLPVERYEEAMRQMSEMRRYSTSLGRHFAPPERSSPDALGAWTFLGPGNIGGRTRAWIIHPTSPDTMYAAGVAGGVWKTTNGGASWTPISDLIANLGVCALAMAPDNPDVIYAGTGESFAGTIGLTGNGVFKTIDGGATWTHLASTAKNSNFTLVNKIVVSPNNSQVVYAATNSGVWRSLDGGTSWSRVHSQPNCVDLVARSDQATDHLFAACRPSNQGAIYRNTDAGGAGTWDQVHTEAGMGRIVLAIAPSNQNIIYALAVSLVPGPNNRYANGLHAVFRSTNGGAAGSWEARVRNTDTTLFNTLLLSNLSIAVCNNTFINQGNYDSVIAVDPVDPNRVWVGGVALFRSDDGGANWGLASCGETHVDYHAVVFHPQYNGSTNKTMFIGNDGGVFKTVDARAAVRTTVCGQPNCAGQVTFSTLNNSYGVTQFYNGAPYPDGKTYLGGAQDNGVSRGTDAAGPNSWTQIQGGDGGYVAVDPNNTNILYVGIQNGTFLKSVNGGASFSPSSTGISENRFLFIAPFVMDPTNSQRLYTGGSKLWRTSNGAANWTQASAELTNNAISSIAISPLNANNALVGTANGFIHRTNAATTTDANTVWPSVRPRGGLVSWVAYDPKNANVAYATYSTFNTQPSDRHVYKSVDGGATWTGIDGSGTGALPDVPTHCIVVDPNNSNRLYVGTDVGVFSSVDGGASWAVENTGFANVITETLAINTGGSTKYLFAFTHGRGAWRVELRDVACSAISVTQTTLPAGLINAAYNQTLTAIGGEAPYTFGLNSGALPPGLTLSPSGALSGSPTASGIFTFTIRATDANGCAGVSNALTLKIANRVTSVSAASFLGQEVAMESIISAFGVNLATGLELANTLPLPTTLRGTSVTVRDSQGIDRLAPLFFVSPGQINLQLPPGTGAGVTTVTTTSGDGQISLGTINVANVAPGLFSANANGQGVAAATLLRVKADGSQTFEPVATLNAQNAFVTRPIDLGPASDLLFLIAFGTGFRFNSGLSAVSCRIGGVNAEVFFAGAQGGFVGLDQANIQIPRSLAGRGEVDVALTVNGKASNAVRINIK
jgi:uncharacterized protein (TIGR03437 family)